jgi:endonuclease III
MAAASNRAARLTKLVSDLKKRYKPAMPPQRPLFETILFATLLENSPPDAADKVFVEIESSYYDWNEVRVSSRSELAERMKPLSDPNGSADRLKRTVQSIFETVYKFDLEELKKQNLGQAVKTITGFDGVTPFVVNYATQHGLAGHAIACNEGVLIAMQVMDIITDAEAKKGLVPGLERAIPKSKGVEAQLVLHELGVEIGRNPYGPAAKKLLTELDPSCKDRLPKKPKAPEPPQEAPTEKAPESKASPAKAPATDKKGAKETDDKKTPPKKSPAPESKPKAASAEAKSASTKTATTAKPTPDKKPAPTKPPVKKVEAKKSPPKKSTPAAKKSASKNSAPKKPAAAPASGKKKPAKKVATKPAAKKAADKKPAKRKPK